MDYVFAAAGARSFSSFNKREVPYYISSVIQICVILVPITRHSCIYKHVNLYTDRQKLLALASEPNADPIKNACVFIFRP